MRFIHCTDLHLDSPLRGLERYEGAPVKDMREAAWFKAALHFSEFPHSVAGRFRASV